MKVLKFPLLVDSLGVTGRDIKFIMNERAIVFFPTSQQHRDMKCEGLSYEDDYLGNAIAGIFVGGKAEIRFHAAFSDDRVRSIWQCLRETPECSALKLGNPTYQGREISF